ncbi:MAG: 3-hydroxy acid dehydrogenase/malonic semialdehyde reductase [Bacteroidia bacterium]|jgi:3-hydroxy acid dehydrogenase/malonic semialdehyde reductase
MKRTAMITGATSGIGASTARLLAKSGFNLILVGRREEQLMDIRVELVKQGAEVYSGVLDVRDAQAIHDFILYMPKHWQEIDILINNAGLAVGLDTINHGKLEDWDRMIDTNVKGLLYVTKEVSQIMVERKTGHIINIGSTAGTEVYANGGVYCASKHAVHALSKAMRIDLLPHGIKVTNVAPGAAETEFSEVRFKGDVKRAKGVYDGFKPLKPEDIAEVILYALSQPEHVCLNEIVMTCTAQANSTTLLRES